MKEITISFNAARGFVGGAAQAHPAGGADRWRFNAARGFVGGAANGISCLLSNYYVSMPHAALWVVQLNSDIIAYL